MTEQVDLDALLAEARRLIAHTRTYNFGMWSADKLAHKVAGELADALESTLADLRQERERADEASHAAGRHKSDAALHEADLSRAEEAIKKAIACEEHTHRIMTDRKPTREDSSLTWRILTEYDKQKGADRD